MNKNSMSTHKCNISSRICNIEHDRCFVVDTQERETLAEYVRRVRTEKDYSLSRVERNSNGAIDGSYVNRVENGLIKNVSPEKLKALAKGLNVSEEEITSIAFGKSPEPMTRERFFAELMAMGVEDFHAAKGTTALTPADMEEILAVIRSTAKTMVEQKIKAKKR